MVDRRILLQRLESVYQRLQLGDPDCQKKVSRWKSLAKAGDPRAKVAYNTLAVLHWRKKDGPLFKQAEVFYNRLMAKDWEAHQQLRRLAQAKATDPRAKRTFSILKAVHHKRKASVWTNGPGAPSTGYHPMPQEHRVGIEFGPHVQTRGPSMGYSIIGASGPQPLSPEDIELLLMLIQAAMVPSENSFSSANPDMAAPAASSSRRRALPTQPVAVPLQATAPSKLSVLTTAQRVAPMFKTILANR